MSAVISEDHIEQVLIEGLLELGYTYVHDGQISPDGPSFCVRQILLLTI